jgi:hypothetical protein
MATLFETNVRSNALNERNAYYQTAAKEVVEAVDENGLVTSPYYFDNRDVADKYTVGRTETETIVNLLSNTDFAGSSGSVGGADFVPPTGWDLGFWNPVDAFPVAFEGHTGMSFEVDNERGYITQTLDASAIVGEIVNFSVFVDASEIQTAQRIIHLQAGATEIRRVQNLTNIPKVSGRFDSLYQITGPSVQVRLGCGTTAPSVQKFTLSRPQITVGRTFYPYVPTP